MLQSGDTWAWQAKYFFQMGAKELQQIDESVQTALDTTPGLTRYMVCVPYDLPTNTGKGKSAEQRWNEHVQKWQAWAERRGLSVEFTYVGESQLLSALMPEKHRGSILYWFSREVLSSEWFQKKLDEVLEEAGPRYTPELNVDVPIASLFDGLGRTREFHTRLMLLLRELRDKRRTTHSADSLSSLDEKILDLIQRSLPSALDRIDALVLGLDVTGFSKVDFQETLSLIRDASGVLSQCLDAIEEEEHRLTEAKKTNEKLRSAGWELRRVLYALLDLKELMESQPARLVNVPALLVLGEAGTGKTHLLCDVARRRLDEGAPTIVLLGQRFADDEPWSQLLRQLDLQCSAEEFLGALDSAAEATGTRALILLDALNEGEGIDLWPKYLRTLLRQLRNHPQLGVALSCRTSYSDVVIPEDIDEEKLVRAVHHGFTDVEFKAVKAYFAHYGLQLPDFPLLVPEFSNPLFLKLMCRSLKQRGLNTLPRGETGVTQLFAGFLSEAEKRLSHRDRCNFPIDAEILDRALDALAQAMLGVGRDFVSLDGARTLTNAILPPAGWESSLLKGMLDEGILNQDVMRPETGKPEITVSFSYQRLGDHLRAQALVKPLHSLDALREKCRDLVQDGRSTYVNSGLIEALTVLLPERFSVEFHELTDSGDSHVVANAYLQSLIWRSIDSFGANPSVDYLNRLSSTHVFRTLLHVSCIPSHPFNAERLHRAFWRISLPERDQWWSTFLSRESDEESIVSRIIHWAWLEDTGACSDDAALLCGTTLAWLLTSSNRRQRDTATKALVSLLTQRPRVLLQLLERFDGVNDPYVAERLYAVAYGCAMRISALEALKDLATFVFHHVFEKGTPPVHVLLRDYARGVIERAYALGVELDFDVKAARPPYRSPWPIRSGDMEKLKETYPESSGWSAIRFSLTGMGDFRRYVIEAAVRPFLAPNQSKLRAAARRAARLKATESWRAFSESLTPEQETALSGLEKRYQQGDFRDETSEYLGRLHELMAYSQALDSILTEEQRKWQRDAEHYMSQSTNDSRIRFDIERASGWILARVFRLGWTPGRFEEFDRSIRGYDFYGQRNEHRRERIGKKYQWIALHELMAMIADHCLVHEGWRDEEPRWFEGPWNTFRRDIDPGYVLPRDNRTNWDQTPITWWSPASSMLPDRPTDEERKLWLEAPAGLPDPEVLIRVADPEGRPCYAVEGYYHWDEPDPPEAVPYQADRCRSWMQIRGYLVRVADVDVLRSWVVNRNWMGRWMPESSEGHTTFLGEHYWHPAAESLDTGWVKSRSYNDDEEMPFSVLPSAASYRWERGYDYSIEESVGGLMPSPELARLLEVAWTGSAYEFEGEAGILARDPSALERGPQALIVDAEALGKACEREGLTLFWTVLGEKMVFGRPSGLSLDETTYWMEVYGAYLLDQNEVTQLSLRYELKSNARAT